MGNSNGAVLGYLLRAWVDGLGGDVQNCDHRWIAALFGVVFALGFVCALWVALLKY